MPYIRRFKHLTEKRLKEIRMKLNNTEYMNEAIEKIGLRVAYAAPESLIIIPVNETRKAA